MSKTNAPASNRMTKRLAVGALLIILLVAGIWKFWGGSAKTDESATFVVRKGKLPINVITGGSLEALESQEIRSEVKGYEGTKILSIIEEGYLVTEDDVKTNKVLIELDSSQIKQKITQQDISFETTQAGLTEAQQAFDIQATQNKTDVKAAEQKVRFALMDLEKFMGQLVTHEIIQQLPSLRPSTNTTESTPLAPKPEDVNTKAKPAAEGAPQGAGKAVLLADASKRESAVLATDAVQGVFPGAGAPSAPVETKPATVIAKSPVVAPVEIAPDPVIDFTKYAKVELLGDGEAKQKLRKLEDDFLVAKSEHGLARTQFEGTQRLAEKGFVTKNNLATEEINLQKSDLKVQTAETARDLFIKYEFPKQAEELLSKYEEASSLADRARKEAVSKLAQAKARLRSAESRYQIEDTNRKELYEQLEVCTIKAKKPGLVVYGGGGDGVYFYNQEPIREGATIRERQPIITIPDTSQMSVKVRIHESHIEKVKKGLKALVRVDAFPDRIMEGEVIKVGLLPDSQNRWMNPDLKVYLTTIKINGSPTWVKPGMSSKVEILVKELPDVVHVPIQAISPEANQQYAYVSNGGGEPERRKVTIGEFNDEFIEVKEGLKEGEKVLLRSRQTSPEGENGAAKPEEKASATPATAAAAPGRA